MSAEQIITVQAQVVIPRVPNFLQMTDGQTIPLCAITEDGLREIAAAWAEALIERAREQGEDRAGPDTE